VRKRERKAVCGREIRNQLFRNSKKNPSSLEEKRKEKKKKKRKKRVLRTSTIILFERENALRSGWDQSLPPHFF